MVEITKRNVQRRGEREGREETPKCPPEVDAVCTNR